MSTQVKLDADVISKLREEVIRFGVPLNVVANDILRRSLGSIPEKSEDQIVLPIDWYHLLIAEGVDVRKPGIYEWVIEGVGSYIGKYTGISRPTRTYGRHVTNLLNNKKAYRPQNPDGYRRIHRELEKAYREGRAITLKILENPESSRINTRERELIRDRGNLNGVRIAAIVPL